MITPATIIGMERICPMLMYCAGTGKLRVGLAEKLNNDAKRAVANQEQARDSSHWARFTNIQVEDNKQHHTFQQQLVKL